MRSGGWPVWRAARRKSAGCRPVLSLAADRAAVAGDGDPVIPDSAHIRLAAAENHDGARILRRGYSYNDGINFTVERWPPWHRGIEYDSGLLFVCYQRDPQTGFIRIYDK